MKHPTPEALERYDANSLTPTERIAVANHVLWCDACREAIRFHRSVVQLMKVAQYAGPKAALAED